MSDALTKIFFFFMNFTKLTYWMTKTKKCDVYSFRVVALETMIGKHPREIISSFSSSSGQDIMLREILNPRLSL